MEKIRSANQGNKVEGRGWKGVIEVTARQLEHEIQMAGREQEQVKRGMAKQMLCKQVIKEWGSCGLEYQSGPQFCTQQCDILARICVSFVCMCLEGARHLPQPTKITCGQRSQRRRFTPKTCLPGIAEWFRKPFCNSSPAGRTSWTGCASFFASHQL